MNNFDKWRREVNIILTSTLGLSLKDLDSSFEEEIQKIYAVGDDPMDAAQFIASSLDPRFDVEDALLNKVVLKSKPVSKKNNRKFKEKLDEKEE